MPEEVLTGYNIKNANEGFDYLLELHHIFDDWAEMIVVNPTWHPSAKPSRNKFKKFVSDWNFAWIELQSTDDKAAYQDWKDHYEG